MDFTYDENYYGIATGTASKCWIHVNTYNEFLTARQEIYASQENLVELSQWGIYGFELNIPEGEEIDLIEFSFDEEGLQPFDLKYELNGDIYVSEVTDVGSCWIHVSTISGEYMAHEHLYALDSPETYERSYIVLNPTWAKSWFDIGYPGNTLPVIQVFDEYGGEEIAHESVSILDPNSGEPYYYPYRIYLKDKYDSCLLRLSYEGYPYEQDIVINDFSKFYEIDVPSEE